MEMISRLIATFLLNAAWQIPLIAGAVWLIGRGMRRIAARHQYRVWVAALTLSVVLPVMSTWFSRLMPIMPAHSSLREASIAAARSAIDEPPSSTGAQSIWLNPETISLLFAAYAIFLILRAAGLVYAARQTVAIYRAARNEAPLPDLKEAFDCCRKAFPISQARLLLSNRITGPVTIGRTIILPEALSTSRCKNLLTTAIGHEMAHLERKDFVWNVMIRLLYIPVSFHPAAWFVAAEIVRTREMSCDEIVAMRLLEPGVYARSLMELAGRMLPLASPSYSLGMFDGRSLEARVRNLADMPRRGATPQLPLITALLGLTLCVGASIAFSVKADAISSAVPVSSMADFTPPPPPPAAPPPPAGWHGTLPAPPLVGEMPPMPEVAQAGMAGLVQLSVNIAKDGTVRSVDVIQGPAPLVSALLPYVRKVVFQRTLRDGIPVEVTTMFTFHIAHQERLHTP